ncbi:hypothetical protein V6C27_07260 [Peptococcaceae bacterium 1198_IL3148]
MLIMLGAAVFTASFIGVVYHLVSIGRITKEELINNRLIKFGIGGLCLILFGQVIIWLAL